MSLLDSFKNRIAVNLKITRMSFMTRPDEILQYCLGFTQEERQAALRNIESQFKWQPVAQMAQALYPTLFGGYKGVSSEAMDLVQGGYVDAGVKLMAMENQAPVAPPMGMLPIQQSALSFAWVVLGALEQTSAAPMSRAAAASQSGTAQVSSYCGSCGAAAYDSSARFCQNCGAELRMGGRI
jgi:hypothetical protein